MTALERYERLECEGQYRLNGAEAAQPVVVHFGNASLTITTFDDVPLAHWPLASLHCEPLEDGQLRIAPDTGTAEALVIEDPTMSDALTAVVVAPVRSQRRLRRRLLMVWVCLGIAVAGAVLWQTVDPYSAIARQVPRSAATQLGLAALEHHAGGRVCTGRAGQRALDRLAAQLSGQVVDGAITLRVVRGTGEPAATVGGVVMIPVAAVARAASADDLAAMVLGAVDGRPAWGLLSLLIRRVGVAGVVDVLRGDLTTPALVSGAAALLAGAPDAGAPLNRDPETPQIVGVALSHLQAICR